MSEFNKIEDVTVRVERYPLKQTYNLSFAALTEFVSIQVRLIVSNGESSMAEVVPLVGYNDESEEIILNNLNKWKKSIVGLSLASARKLIAKEIQHFSFSSSPILTAIDLFDFEPLEVNHDEMEYVVPTSTIETEKFKKLLLEDRVTIKVKLTGKPETDITGLSKLLTELKSYSRKLRFDANQAYTYEGARVLFDFLKKSALTDKVEYIEQALPVGKENEIGKLRSEYPSIHMMLDESIVLSSDLALAEENDVKFIKLKLFKQGGIKELIEIAELASQKNIKVILGNGVATSISNAIENQVFCLKEALFFPPLESNGFKKVAVYN